jgi:hypothetical protein
VRIKEGWLYKLRQKTFLCILKATEKSRNRSRIRNSVVRIRGSGSYKNVTDPQHCQKADFSTRKSAIQLKNQLYSAFILPIRNRAQDSCDFGIGIQTLCTVPKSDLCLPRNETAWPCSHAYIHVSVSDLYTIFQGSVCLFGWSKIGRLIFGIY